MADSTNEKKQAKRKLTDAQLKRELRDATRLVMGMPEGRRMVWNLLNVHCNYFGGSFTGEQNTTAYNEGKRGVGISLVLDLQRDCHVDYVQMLRERMVEPERQRAEEKEIKRDPKASESPNHDYHPLELDDLDRDEDEVSGTS